MHPDDIPDRVRALEARVAYLEEVSTRLISILGRTLDAHGRTLDALNFPPDTEAPHDAPAP